MEHLSSRKYNTENLRSFNSQTAREAAKKSAAVRQRKKDIEAYFRHRLDSKLDTIMDTLEKKALEGDLKTVKFFLEQAGYSDKSKKKTSIFEEMNDLVYMASHPDEEFSSKNTEYSTRDTEESINTHPMQKDTSETEFSSYPLQDEFQSPQYIPPDSPPPSYTSAVNLPSGAYSIPIQVLECNPPQGQYSQNDIPPLLSLIRLDKTLCYETSFSFDEKIHSLSAISCTSSHQTISVSSLSPSPQIPCCSSENVPISNPQIFSVTAEKRNFRFREKKERTIQPSSFPNTCPVFLKSALHHKLLARHCTRSPDALRKNLVAGRYLLKVYERTRFRKYSKNIGTDSEFLRLTLNAEYYRWNPPPPMDFRRVENWYVNPITGEKKWMFEDLMPRQRMHDLGIPFPEESIPAIVFDPTAKSPNTKLYLENANSSRFFHAERENRPFFKSVYWEDIKEVDNDHDCDDDQDCEDEEDYEDEEYYEDDNEPERNFINNSSANFNTLSFFDEEDSKPSVIDHFVAFLLSPVRKDSELTWVDDLMYRFSYMAQEGDINPLLKFARMMKTVESMKKEMSTSQIIKLLKLFEKNE